MHSRPETNRSGMPDFWTGFNEEPVKRSAQEVQDEVSAVQEDADTTLDEIDALLGDLDLQEKTAATRYLVAAPGDPSIARPEGRTEVELLPLEVSGEVRKYVDGLSDQTLADFVSGALVSHSETHDL